MNEAIDMITWIGLCDEYDKLPDNEREHMSFDEFLELKKKMLAF